MAEPKKQRAVPTARSVAAHVVERVLKDQAFAAAALDAELGRLVQLEARDRGLATELVYGTLRARPALEQRIDKFAPRGVRDEIVKAHLLIAAYQILMLDRVPAFAAVDAAVEHVSSVRGQKVGGFVNAVLRKLARSGERLSVEQAALESAPEWLLKALEQSVGPEETRALIGADAERPSVNVRLIHNKPIPEFLAHAEAGRYSEQTRILRAAGDPRRQPEYAQGAFVVQEEGAQIVALALGARPGELILDACAGRGQKSALIAERLADTGKLWVTDAYPAKLEALTREFTRLELPAPEQRPVDLSIGTGDLPDTFDRILVDAPCTGTGTLRHRPEILARLKPEDPERLSELAEKIVRNSATLLKPGGRLIFAVCSVLRAECENIAARVADVLTPAPFDAEIVQKVADPGATSFRLLPKRHGTDGYFVASFVKG